MVKDGRGVAVRLVVLLTLAATGLAYVGLRWWSEQGNGLPAASWGAAVLVIFMAVGVYFAGLPVRRFLRGQARRPLNPMRAMRALVLAQAAALTGALVTGWYAAQALVLLPDVDVDSVRSALVRVVALAVSGAVMATAGLLAQAMCRLDDNDNGNDVDQE